MKTNQLFTENNKKLLENLIPEKGSAFEQEFIIWIFKIYLN
jgi:hypothetical protein